MFYTPQCTGESLGQSELQHLHLSKWRIILPCLAKCYDSEFLKHCQLQAGIKYMGMQRMVITLILSAVGVLLRDLSTAGISLISLFEVVCQNAFQFARETICMHLGACQNISEKQNAFSRSFQITKHLHNTQLQNIHYLCTFSPTEPFIIH